MSREEAVKVTAFPESEYSPSGRQVAEVSILSPDTDYFRIECDRTDLDEIDESDAVKCGAEISLDDGATWKLLIGFTTNGKRALKREDGTIETESWASCRLPVEIKGIPRQIRCFMEAVKSIRTKVDWIEETRALARNNGPDAHHSVAYDDNDQNAASGVTALSWTHTPTGTPTGVGVGIVWYSGDDAIATITYGGTTMGAAVVSAVSAAPERASIYGLASPAAGAQTVAISWGGAITVYPVGISISVTGGDPTTCFSNSASATGNSTTPSVVCTSATDELVMDCCVLDAGAPTFTPGAGQTQRGQGSSGGLSGQVSTEAGAASVTMSQTGSASGPWATVAASFKAAAGGATVKPMYYFQNMMAGAQ